MDLKDSLLDAITDSPDDGDLTMSFADWFRRLTPTTRAGLREAKARRVEAAARHEGDGADEPPTGSTAAHPGLHALLGRLTDVLDRMGPPAEPPGNVAEQLGRVEVLLCSLVEREQVKDWYEVEEFARLVGEAEFTCREWCRLRRIRGEKKGSGRGKYQGWVISHAELLRYRREGLLPRPVSGPRPLS